MSIEKIIKIIFCTILSCQCSYARQFTLMLDPAGDAKHAGRIIEDSFERGITLQCAEKLKKYLEYHDPTLRVILTRFPGESLEPLQNANFANRLEVDLYVSFHFYYEDVPKPELFVYYFCNDATDGWQKPMVELAFVPYDKAHRATLTLTKKVVEVLEKSLKKDSYASLFDYKGTFGIPFKPLVGIACPALGFEISLKKKDQWSLYLEPMMQSLFEVISTVEKNI